MFPGLMAVKFNLFALPVLEGDGEQGLLQSRCPGSHQPLWREDRDSPSTSPPGSCGNEGLWPSGVG